MYVYLQEDKKRIAFLNELSEFEIDMNRLKPAGVVNVEKGNKWAKKVSELIEELVEMMNRPDKKESFEWAKSLLNAAEQQLDVEPEKESEKEKDVKFWFMETIENLQDKKYLSEFELLELEYALNILDINESVYGFDSDTGKFPK